MKKIPIFDQTHGLTPLQKFEFFPLFRKEICMSKKAFFSIKSISKQYFQAYFAQKQSMEKIPIFDQNHGLTPLQKFEFLPLFRKDIFMLKKVFFSILSISKKYFQAHFPQKQSMEKIPIFDQNDGPKRWTLCKNSNFATFLKRSFYVKEYLLLYLEYQQTIFLGLLCPKTKYGKNTNF